MNTVKDMLKKIAMEIGGMTYESADEMFKTMKKERRYQRDVYWYISMILYNSPKKGFLFQSVVMVDDFNWLKSS